MAKYLLGLIAAGVVAFVVKGFADDAGKRLLIPTEAKVPAAKAPVPGEVVPFDDPLGFYRVMLPGAPSQGNSTDSHWMHGIGRSSWIHTAEKKVHLQLAADFVGSDEPNTPRATLTWVVKKDLGRAQKADLFKRVKFSRGAGGVEVADYRHEWRGNGARGQRTRHVLFKKWLYTLTASGEPDEIDAPEVLAFFDSFALTDKALTHPEGGARKP